MSFRRSGQSPDPASAKGKGPGRAHIQPRTDADGKKSDRPKNPVLKLKRETGNGGVCVSYSLVKHNSLKLKTNTRDNKISADYAD